MKAKIETIGCEKNYGEERVVFNDEKHGKLTINEIEFDSSNELLELIEEVDTIKVESTRWSSYDVEIVAVCGNL